MRTVEPEAQHRRQALASVIEGVLDRLQPLHLAHHEAIWLANTTGDPAHTEASARLDAEVRTFFSAREPYARLRALVEAGGVGEPALDRQLWLLFRDFQAHQIPAARIAAMVRLEHRLEQTFHTFRAEFEGRPVGDNVLRDVLRQSDDEARRRDAWEASKQVGGAVEGTLLELVRERNDAARDLGYDNYYSMRLAFDELDEAQLFEWLDVLERGTRAAFESYKDELDAGRAARFGRAPGELRPWHYDDPFFQEAPFPGESLDPYFETLSLEAVTERFFAGIGLEIGDLLGRADLYERPGKNQQAFCLCVDRGRDIRVLCNLRPNEYSMSTILHEFGHAAYDAGVDPSLPYLLRGPAHILTTEASAMLFGRLTRNAAWLARHAGVPAAEARRVADRLAGGARAQLLLLTRWCLVMAHMERALYREPGRDLSRLWWDLVERFQGVQPPSQRTTPDWACKAHFSVAPVYYHNYLLGEMMASQLQNHLLTEVLGGGPQAWDRFVTAPEVGNYLRTRLYQGGKSMDWRDTLRAATGRSLDPEAFARELSAPAAGAGRKV